MTVRRTLRRTLKVVGILCLFFFIFSACDIAESAGDQLGFLLKMSKQYGGSWHSSVNGTCYRIEITNPTKISTDSIEYIGADVGRKLLKETGQKNSCLELILVKQKKILIYTESSSSSYSFDLDMIRRFKNIPLDEYIEINQSILASQQADQNDIEEAEKIYDRIQVPYRSSFPYLAKAHIERAKQNSVTAENIIHSILSSEADNDLIYQYIGLYHSRAEEYDLAAKMFNYAHRADPKNTEHLFNLGFSMQKIEKNDSCVYWYTEFLETDTLNRRALYERAICLINQDKIERACDDISRILAIEPRTQLPDQVLRTCQLIN